MNELCSVVVPSHNRRERLLGTLATLRAQTYAPLEIIISDDGSSDRTQQAVEEIDDPRVRVVRSERGTGVALARNRGIEAANGRWVAFCDDDDFWTPGKIAGQIHAMRANDNRWAFCRVAEVDDDMRVLRTVGGIPKPPFTHRLVFANRIPGGCSTVIVERSLLDEAGHFDPEFSMFADLDLWVRLAELGEPTVWLEVGTIYVHHAEQMSMDMSKIVGELSAFRTKHHERRSAHEVQRFEPIDRWLVRRLWMAGQYRDALRHARLSEGRQGFVHGLMTIGQTVVSGVGSGPSAVADDEARAALASVAR